MIHSVLDLGSRNMSWHPLRTYLTTDLFQENLITLAKHHTFISIADAVAISKGEREPVKNGIVLTFDDGYLNAFTDALPVMEDLGIPGTFFVVPGKVISQEPFWFDRFDFAVQSNCARIEELTVLDTAISLGDQSRQSQREAMLQAFRILKKHYANDLELHLAVNAILEEIEAIEGKSLPVEMQPDDPTAIVDKDSLVSASKNPLVTIGSHTMDHIRVTGIDDDELDRQLVSSSQILTDWLGESCEFFFFHVD